MSGSQAFAAEALRQLIQGTDFEPSAQLLKSVTPSKAVAIPEGCPYSIATNIAHAEQWQRSWLSQLKGLPKFDVYSEAKDFPVLEPGEWPAAKTRFIEGLDDAYAIATSEPFSHHAQDDEAAAKLLLRIALHGAYHLGQVKLLKRVAYAQGKRNLRVSREHHAER